MGMGAGAGRGSGGGGWSGLPGQRKPGRRQGGAAVAAAAAGKQLQGPCKGGADVLVAVVGPVQVCLN